MAPFDLFCIVCRTLQRLVVSQQMLIIQYDVVCKMSCLHIRIASCWCIVTKLLVLNEIIAIVHSNKRLLGAKMSEMVFDHVAKSIARLSRLHFTRLILTNKVYSLWILVKLHFCQYLWNHEGKSYKFCVSKSASIFAKGILIKY